MTTPFLSFCVSAARRVKSEVSDQSWILNHSDHSKPDDASLGSSWVDHSAYWKRQNTPTDTIGALLGDDSGTELKNTSASTRGLNSCSWFNMPAVRQMSDIH